MSASALAPISSSAASALAAVTVPLAFAAPSAAAIAASAASIMVTACGSTASKLQRTTPAAPVFLRAGGTRVGADLPQDAKWVDSTDSGPVVTPAGRLSVMRILTGPWAVFLRGSCVGFGVWWVWGWLAGGHGW